MATGRPLRRRRSAPRKSFARRLLLERLEVRTVLSHFAHTFEDINPHNSDRDATDPDAASMGRVNGLATTSESSILYAASEFGGLFKSADHGDTWDHLDGHLPQLTWDVEVDPSNPNRVYVTSFYDGRVNPITGIQISSDGGATWTHPLTSDANPALEGTPNDNTPQANYAANALRTSSPAAYGIAIRPDAPNNVAIGTNAGLAISNDSGATWRIIDPQKSTPAPPAAGTSASNIWDVIWQPGGANGIIDVVGDTGHHRSTDGGTTWTANSLPAAAQQFPNGVTRLSSFSIAASPDESYVLYVVAPDNNLYETVNATVAAPVWTNIGATDPLNGGGRLPFVQTNNTTAGFDLWTGGVSLYRVTGTNGGAPGGGSRIPLAANPLNVGWAGPFTRDGSPLPPPASQASHDDVGDIIFDTEVANDAIPLLFSSDGGVYRNTPVGDVTDATTILGITVVTTTLPHTLNLGDTVLVTGVQGNPNANGTFGVVPLTATTFSYISGGLASGSVPNTGHWHLASQTPRWEQPTRGPHALWLFGMASVDLAGDDAEAIYTGQQDTGNFANTVVGQDDPNAVAAAWHNQICCDIFDLGADDDTVLYNFGGTSDPERQFQLFLGDFGLSTGGQVNTYPGNVPAAANTAASGGQVAVFQNAESLENFGDDTYAVLMRDDPASTNGQDDDTNGVIDDEGFNDGGLHITTNVQANPIVWTELVGNTGNEPWNSATPAEVQVAMNGGTPTFFITVGSGGGYTADQLWSYVGTNPNANAWTRLDTNIDPGDVGGGVSLFAVDPNNPNRLYASYIDPATGPRMVFSTDGGLTWQNDPELDFFMTGGGAFNMQNQRGPRDFPDQEDSGNANRGIGVSFQPSLLAFDPEDANIIAAGALDAGVFLSTDSGNSWRLLTDPFGGDDDPTTTLPNGLPLDDNPHISRPRYAHFDHETDKLVELYIGSQGRGVWRIGVDFDRDIDELDEERPNNSIATATVLGSLQKITLRDMSIHEPTDVDFYQYTAQDTGKLIVNMYLDSLGGNLNLRVRDINGNIIAEGIPANLAAQLDNEQLVIPVVSQERYYIEVYSPDGHTNCYDLEIENFPAPVPIAVDLAAEDDTGRSDSDNVTFDPLGAITILADLFDFADMGIDILTPAEVAASEAGAAVEVFVRGVSQGFATADALSDNTLFNFTFGAGDLAQGLNFVTAAVRIFDGKNPQADGRSQLSEPLLLTLDTIDPATPLAPNLLAASDSGSSETDNVTNVNQPAFNGNTERNAVVRVRAGGTVVGQGLSTSAGAWEITVEPLRDNVYDVTVEVEDLAGNVSDLSDALQMEIDTLAPNTAHLDLVESSDTGRHNDDNITKDNTPDMSATTDDPPATNGASHISDTNFIFRIYDRLENSDESLIYLTTLTSATQVTPTLPALADGIHNLKLEVEDRAGNISHDFLLDVLIDTVAPTGTAHLFPDSDSGIWGFDETMSDLITSDMTPLIFGATEANALVRAALDRDPADPADTGTPDGTAVAIPLDGDDAFPPPPEFDGNYFLQTILNLADGEHTLEFHFQDVAGNESPVDEDATLVIFIDTAGPKITNVTRGDVSTDNVHSFDGVTSVFEPKPSDNGPDPLVHSIVIHFSDLPDRTEAFADYHALFLALAEEEGNYQVIGDHNGNIAIVDVNVTFLTTPDDGLPEIARVELVFDRPLPDDRYTVRVSDNLSDGAGNPLDGESGAQGPFEGNDVPLETPPIFPTGDGEHGGSFAARFTIDSRPEFGAYALGTTYIDINGNAVFDPEGQDNDYTNRDIAFVFGFRDDRVFAGNFAPAGAASASGFDKLGAYGNAGAGSAWRFRLDFDHDGVVDYDVPSGVNNSADPVAGNFSAAHPGDEIGLFNSGKWYLDTGGDNNVAGPGDTQLNGNMKGQPIVGDFDGDGLDDLGAWDGGNAGTQFDGFFQFDLASNGLTGVADATIQFDLPGTFQKAIAADMNEDGIDDVGLFVTRREAIPPGEAAEWFMLVSNTTLEAHGTVNALNHLFTPVPFGNDLFAQFGDEAASPVVGNFDPPTGPVGNTGNQNPLNPLDVNNDGRVSVFDALLVVNHMNVNGVTSAAAGGIPQAPFLDVNRDLRVSAHDAVLIVNRLNALASSAGSSASLAEGEADPGSTAGDAIDSELLAVLADDQESLRRRRR